MSRKSLKGILVAVVLVVAYLGLSWATGHMARERLQVWHEVTVREFPLMKLVDRRVEGGLFESVEYVTYEIDTGIFDGLFEDAQLHEALELEEAELPRFTLRNRIQHGPLPGFRGFGMARIESGLELEEDERNELKEIMGTDQPFKSVISLGFGGGGTLKLTSPAFEMERPDENELINWSGAEGDFSFNRNLTRVAGQLIMPGLRIAEEGTDELVVGEIRLDADLRHAFDKLMAGAVSVRIAEMKASGLNKDFNALDFKGLHYEVRIDHKEDFFDVVVKAGADSFVGDEIDLRNLHYDLSLLHLHGPTYVEFVERAQKLAWTSAPDDPMTSLAMMVLLAEYGPRLLEHDPVIAIDHVGCAFPEGEMGVSARVWLDDFKREDLMLGGLALIPKLKAEANLWMSESLVEKDWSVFGRESAGKAPAATHAQKVEALRAQLGDLEQQGYITRNGDRLESRMKWSDGGLTVNGKPMPIPGMGMPGAGRL